MKKFTLLLGLLMLSQVNYAQDCNPVTNYVQDFEAVTVPGFPDCTTHVNAGTGNNWITVNNPGNGFTSNTLQYTANANPANAWLFTKAMQITAGTYYKISYKYGNNSTTATEGFAITIGTNPDVASVTTTIASHDAVTGGNQQNTVINFFPGPGNGVYYFGIHATSAANQGNLYIDDFAIEEMVCGTPDTPQVTNITDNSATISWGIPTGGNVGMISVYQYALVETNTPPADGVYNPTLSKDLTDLIPGTTYYVFTRTLCGPLWSDWTEPVIFTTPPCTPVTTPHTEDFETATLPGIPACTIAVNTGSGNNWVSANSPGNSFTDKTLQYSANANAADAWFFTQGIELTAGTLYKVSYKYGNNSTTATESLKVTFGTNPSPSFVTSNFADHPTVTGGEPTVNAIDFFNVPESGVYYFGFNAYSAANQGNLYVDDFIIDELVCGTPDGLNAANVTDDSVTIGWFPPTTGNSGTVSVYQYAIGTIDTPPADGIYNPGPTVDVAELEPATTYYVFARTLCGPVWSDWVMISFTTEDELGVSESNFNGFSYHPNPVINMLKFDSPTEIEKIEVYNVTGQLVLQQNNSKGIAEIDMSALTAGAYLVTISAGDEIKRIKLVKQ